MGKQRNTPVHEPAWVEKTKAPEVLVVESSFALKALKNRLLSEKARQTVELRENLTNLKVRIENTICRLNEDNHVDEHLVSNAAGITASIARWNLTIDLLPVLELVDPEDTE